MEKEDKNIMMRSSKNRFAKDFLPLFALEHNLEPHRLKYRIKSDLNETDIEDIMKNYNSIKYTTNNYEIESAFFTSLVKVVESSFVDVELDPKFKDMLVKQSFGTFNFLRF